jgi:inorganic pyrophosphatase
MANTGEPAAFDVVVEIPKGQRNKYEMDHTVGRICLDCCLFTATSYPADYGYIEKYAGPGRGAA